MIQEVAHSRILGSNKREFLGRIFRAMAATLEGAIELERSLEDII